MTTKPESDGHQHGPADIEGHTGIERAKIDDREERRQLKGQSQGDILGAGFLLAMSEDYDSRDASEKRMHPYHQALDALTVRVKQQYPEMPTFAAGDRVKLAAAWLIERSGFPKGTIRGRAGTSTKHSLAIINRGGATAAEILALADEIQRGVRSHFGIGLEAEPVIV